MNLWKYLKKIRGGVVGDNDSGNISVSVAVFFP